jgi:hypothetical protein
MGCSAMSSATTVTINPLPTATISPNTTTTICEGDSVILTAGAANTYLWSNGATTQSIVVSTPGNYSVTVANASGCSATSSSTTVTVNPLPIAAITPSGSATICQGDVITLAAATASSYLWSNGAKSQRISVSTPGSYSVKVTNAEGCSATSPATTVIVNPLPVTTVTQTGSILSADTKDATYQWLDCGKDFAPIKGATQQSYNATTNGNYAVSISANGCSDTSACYNVAITGVNDKTIDERIKIYPNPTSGKLMIESASMSIERIEMYNVLGENILRYDALQLPSEIDISVQPSGIYYVIVRSVNREEVIKVVKF